MNSEISKEDIERNFKLAEEGKPLDMPLSQLDGVLKKKFIYQKTDKYKAYQKAYRKTDKYKAYKKAYRKTDKWKAYMKAYNKTYYQKTKLRGKK